MNNIQITELSPLPDSELFEKSIDWNRQMLAMAFGIPKEEYGLSPLEKIKEAYFLLEILKGATNEPRRIES